MKQATAQDIDALISNEQLLDELADRLAERLIDRLTLPATQKEALVDANEIARLTGKTRDWVYDHAGDLGAVRLGTGPKARLGFFPARVLEHLEKVAEPAPQPPPPRAEPRRPRRRHRPSDGDLLPIRGAVAINNH